MSSLLSVRLIADTSAREVLGWKCIGLQDMNLEIHVHNPSDTVITVKSEVWLEGPAGVERVDYLYPHGAHALGARDTMSFFCSIDEGKLAGLTHVTVIDGSGGRHRARISGEMEPAEPATFEIEG